MTPGAARAVPLIIGCLLLVTVGAQAAVAAMPQRATVYKVPNKIQSDCYLP
jgi:hypothetical protein